MNEKHGKLTLIRSAVNGKALFKCDCGKEKEINLGNVRVGLVKSCGCLRGQTRGHNLLNNKYGKLTVLSKAESRTKKGKTRRFWTCKCECGQEKEVLGEALLRGMTKSCGCERYQTGEAHHNFKHGFRSHPLYSRLMHMIERCERENHPNYSNYGGRGVKVEEPWRSDPISFITWFQKEATGLTGPLQVDRKDNNGNYSSANCRLVSSEVNNNNRRNNKMIKCFGEELTLVQAVRKFSQLKYGTVQSRIDHYWDIEDALLTPLIR